MRVRGHWLRGAVGGLCLGLALGIMLTLYGVVGLGDAAPAWILLASIAFGIGWSFVAPRPRPRRSSGPTAPEVPEAPDTGPAPLVESDD